MQLTMMVNIKGDYHMERASSSGVMEWDILVVGEEEFKKEKGLKSLREDKGKESGKEATGLLGSDM